MKAHPSALVDPGAVVADDVEIGPYCIVGAGAKIGPGCRLGPRVAIHGPAVVGRDNVFHAHVSIGSPQGAAIEIGDSNVFREAVSVAVSATDREPTRIGSRNYFGVWVSVGMGCRIGNDAHVGSFTTLGDRSEIQDHAGLETLVVIDPALRVGRGSRSRSLALFAEDVPPFMAVDGVPGRPQGLSDFRPTPALDRARETIWNSGLSRKEAMSRLKSKSPESEVEELLRFLHEQRPREDPLE